MKNLAIFRRVATLLFLMLTSVTLWGQSYIYTNWFKINGISDYYDFTGEVIPVSFSFLWYYDEVVDPDDYTYQYYKNGVAITSSEIIDEACYKLTITAKAGSDYAGSVSQDFYVIKSHPLSGTGESGNPYIIDDEEDWIEFATHSTYWGSDKHVKLDGHITVGEVDGSGNITRNALMVGDATHPFMGTFDGNNDTLTFYYKFAPAFTAPFRYTDGATIENIVTNGAIVTYFGMDAGLIGVNTRTSGKNTTVHNVVVGVDLLCNDELWENEGGGFAVIGKGISFNTCVYNGKMAGANYDGGFCGKGDDYTSFIDCVFNPAAESLIWGQNFVYYSTVDEGYSFDPGPAPNIDYSTCYYTMATSVSVSYGNELSTQGISSYSPLTPGNIGHHETTILGNEIYTAVDVVISGINDDYTYNGANQDILYSVTNNGDPAIPTVCSAVITNSNGDVLVDEDGNPVYYVKDIGTYNFVVVGNKEKKYYGSKIKTFSVISGAGYGNWSDLQALLDGDTNPIELDKDYRGSSSDAVLTINRNVTINMNGHTIDRHLSTAQENGWVIKVPSGKTVTINNGTITGGYNKAYSNNENDNNDGGGIHNMGNLTLNNVVVTSNKVIKKIAGSTSYTARGGGVYSDPNSTFTMNHGSISGNAAEGGGGGLFGKNATFTMNYVNISGNECLDKGGGIRITGNATLNHCDIRNNVLRTKNVSDGGGVYYGGGGTFRLNDCKIRGNQATKQGGGFFTLGGTTYFKNCDIVDNFAFDYDDIGNSNYGGGICMLGGTIYMDSVAVVGNISRQDGCGIYVKEGGAKLHIKNYIKVFDNYKTEKIAGPRENNNVYLSQTTTKIKIDDDLDPASYIGVIKKGDGNFTDGLTSHGSISNFASDVTTLYVLPGSGEAKMGVLRDFPTGEETVTVSGPMVIDDRSDAASTNKITISGDGILYIVNSGYVDAVIHNDVDDSRLIVEDGGQVIIRPEAGGTKPVPATMEKKIKAAEMGQYWYLISSGVGSPEILTKTNLITASSTSFPTYDLYRFNDGPTNEGVAYIDEQNRVLYWENYRSTDPVHAGFSPSVSASALQNGRGYLYRNYYDHTITISGDLNTGDVGNYVLTYNATLTYNDESHDNIFKGFNIIGNPYPHNIKKGADQAITNDYLETNYYVLQENGTWLATEDGAEIPPMTGILVQAKSTANGKTLTMKDVPVAAEAKSDEKSVKNNVWFTVGNDEFEDRACVEFNDGHGLNKMTHENENAPMLYFHHKGERFASVDLGKADKAVNLYFEPKKTGFFTLSVQLQGNYTYLHLIDKLAGKDINLLETNEYTFVGSAADDANRFIVRVGKPDNDEDDANQVFAYQSGNEIVVEGEGELQVFDVMGRLVMTQHVSGVEAVEKPSQNGVYILRLNDKTQKVVVR